MSALNRRVTGAVLGSLLALGGTAVGPAAAAGEPRAAACGPVDESHIQARWTALGGQNSALGCPVGDLYDVYVGGVKRGERQYFQYGSMTHSPAQGPDMVVSAWERRGYAYFNWGTTSPYHYDVFLYRWTSPADAQGEQRQTSGGTSGQVRVVRETTGAYKFKVEGCDDGTFGLTCRQGWTLTAPSHG